MSDWNNNSTESQIEKIYNTFMNCVICDVTLTTHYEIHGRTCRDCRKKQRRKLGTAYLLTCVIFAFLAVSISPLFWLLSGIFGLSAYECLNWILQVNFICIISVFKSTRPIAGAGPTQTGDLYLLRFPWRSVCSKLLYAHTKSFQLGTSLLTSRRVWE